MSLTVHVIQTGIANLASILAALERLDAVPKLTDSPEVVRMAEAVVLPGVGAYAAGMERLRQGGLDHAVVDRVREGRPLLAVCLGMQMLCEGSAEAPGSAGLGVISGKLDKIDRHAAAIRVPHIGWNRVEAASDCRVLQSGFAYFAHSFRLLSAPDGWSSARTDYGGLWVAALERGPILACQFHPELSGAWGLGLLGRWLSAAQGTAA